MAAKRLKPEFFIIGERKCGSSSLYRYLLEHPEILPCKIKEPRFFSKPGWFRWMRFHSYQSLFPPAEGSEPAEINWFYWEKGKKEISKQVLSYSRELGKEYITGEASANYFAQAAPRSIINKFPTAKCFLLIRNPADRALSHYLMLLRFKKEGRKLPFEPVDFVEDINTEISQLSKGNTSFFISPGIYLPGIRKWRETCRDNFIVLLTEDLAIREKTQILLSGICRKLGISEFDFSEATKDHFNVTPEKDLEGMQEGLQLLKEFYRPHVTQLESYLGYQTGWY